MTTETGTTVRVSTLLAAARNADGSANEPVLREKLRRCFELQKRAFPFEISIRLMTSRRLHDSELEEELLPPTCAEIMSRWLYGNEPDFSIDAVQNTQQAVDLLRVIHDALDDRLFTFFKGPDFAKLSNRERNLATDRVTTSAMAMYLTETSLTELSMISMRWTDHCTAAKQPSVLESLGLTTMLDLRADELVRLDLVNRLENERREKVNNLWLFLEKDGVGSKLVHAYQRASRGYERWPSRSSTGHCIISSISSANDLD